jgi:hypothetical protein
METSGISSKENDRKQRLALEGTFHPSYLAVWLSVT